MRNSWIPRITGQSEKTEYSHFGYLRGQCLLYLREAYGNGTCNPKVLDRVMCIAFPFMVFFTFQLGVPEIFPIEEYITYNTTYMHEYGHYIQSQQTGYLYALTAACSFLATKWIYAGKAEFSQKDWVPRVIFSGLRYGLID